MGLDNSDRILVTGAAGLVGSALVDHLRAEGFENVIPLQRTDCDLLDTSATFAHFESRRPDHVFHAAARVYGLGGSIKHQGSSFYENVVINTNVVEASRRAGARKITVMGTGGSIRSLRPACR
jgi:GDP-L-fucose synthase